MFERLRLHPDRPQARLISKAAERLVAGAAAVLPTDATYVLATLPAAADAQAAIRQLRRLDERHWWSLICRDLSQAAHFARMDNVAHRLLRRCLPGPYTFILPATSRLPRRVFGKRRDVGIRMPDHAVCRALLEAVDEPLLATTLRFPDEEEAAMDPDAFAPRLKGLDAVLLDAGWGGMTPTTVLDLCGGEPELVRPGLGPWPA